MDAMRGRSQQGGLWRRAGAWRSAPHPHPRVGLGSVEVWVRRLDSELKLEFKAEMGHVKSYV